MSNKQYQNKRRNFVNIIPKFIIVANGVAAILMFCSWAIQNIYLANKSSTKTEIIENSRFVTAEMGTALQWMLTFQKEVSSANPNPEVVLNSAQGYVNSFENILKAAANIDPKSKNLQDHLLKFNERSKIIRNAAKNRNLQEIINQTQILMNWIKSIDSEAESSVQEKYNKVMQAEATYTQWFRLTYILASIIFAITWWKLNIIKLRKNA